VGDGPIVGRQNLLLRGSGVKGFRPAPPANARAPINISGGFSDGHTNDRTAAAVVTIPAASADAGASPDAVGRGPRRAPPARTAACSRTRTEGEMRDDHTTDDDGPAAPGGWLTYRYRLGGDGAAEASGTIKAPSFAGAARRLVEGRLVEHVRSAPVYLRLRAAGQEEVLMHAWRDAQGMVRVEPVPPDSYHFPPPDLAGSGS
jgi:hypothetical protein